MGFPLNFTFFIFQLTVRPLKNPVLSVLISSHLVLAHLRLGLILILLVLLLLLSSQHVHIRCTHEDRAQMTHILWLGTYHILRNAHDDPICHHLILLLVLLPDDHLL